MRYSQFTSVEEIVEDAVNRLSMVGFVPAEFSGEVEATVGRMIKRFGKEVKDLDDKELKKVEEAVEGMKKRVLLNDPFFTLNFHSSLERTGFKIGLFSGLYLATTVAVTMAAIYFDNH